VTQFLMLYGSSIFFSSMVANRSISSFLSIKYLSWKSLVNAARLVFCFSLA
jgi:hypothetical protein